MAKVLEQLGRFSLMLRRTWSKPENFSLYWKAFMEQCMEIGIRSLPIVIFVSFFLGMVVVLQTAYMLTVPAIPKAVIGTVARDSIILELGPTGIVAVLACIVGFRIASELGYMRLSEQIDAQEIMGINTYSYIILPKILASMITVPCLIIIGSVVGILAGGLAGDMAKVVAFPDYLFGLQDKFKPHVVSIALVKSVVFAFILPTVPAFIGYHVDGDSQAVGKASTRAVTYTCVALLTADYIVTSLML
jgi:phospholipid/cholesterol/gamma-HCH transport system permease protein